MSRKMMEKTLLPPSGIIYPLNEQGRCEFEEVAVYFSEEEWGCLTGEEKDLYREVMMENFRTLRSLGQIRATPPIISVIEQGKEPCVRGLRPPSETGGPLNIHHTEADGVTPIRQTETAPSLACLSHSSDAARCCAKRRRSPCIDQRKKMKATSSVPQESTSQQLHVSRPAEQPRFNKEPTLKKVLPEHSAFTARKAHPSVCIKEEPEKDNPAGTSSSPAPRAHAEYTPAQIRQEPAEDNPAPAPRTHTKYTSTHIKQDPAGNPAETSSTPAPRTHAEYTSTQIKQEPAEDNPAPAPRTHTKYMSTHIKQEPAGNPAETPTPAPRTHAEYTSTQIKQEPAGNNTAETSTPAPQAHAEYTSTQIKQEPAGNPAETSSVTPNTSIASTPARHPSTLITEESAIHEEGKVTNGEVNSSAAPREYTSTHIRDLGFFVRILKGFIFAESEASPTIYSDLGMQQNDPKRTQLPSECRIVFSSNGKNAPHQVIHTKEAFSCSKCKENFQSKSDLETHVEIHLLEEGFRCSDCGKCFDHRSKLTEHLVSQNLASSDCVKKDGPNATHFRKALHIEQQRTSNGDLVTYVSMKTTSDNERKFAGAEGWPPAEQTPAAVTSSDKTTENPDSESHGYFTRSAGHVIDQHSNELDKRLSEWEKMSSKPRQIRRQRIHNQKVYPCSKCKKIFEQKSNLLAHEQIHLRETIFKSATLRKSFGYSASSNTGEHGNGGTSGSKENCLPVASLGSGVCVGPHQPKNQEVRHMHTSSDGQRRTNGDANKKEKLTCLVCGESFIYNSDLLLHLRAHSGAKPPECSGCGKSFKNYVDLVIHQKTHREGKESPGSGKFSVCHKPSGRSGSW